MKKINTILFFLTLVLCSCDYHIKLAKCEVALNFNITENAGFLVTVEAVPDEDNVCYLYSIYESRTFDSIMSLYNDETKMMQSILDGFEETYENVYKYYYEASGHQYIAEFHDVMLKYARSGQTFANLVPSTDYTVFGFCVDPYEKTPIGGLQTLRFKTTKIPDDALNMSFDFMIQDSPEHFYYYVKPSYHGQICKDFYFTNIVSEEELNTDYDGNLFNYIYTRYALFSGMEMLELLLSYDISRHEDLLIHYDEVGKSYILFAVPYNPKYQERIYTYHFKYEPNMQTGYTHDKFYGDTE